MGGTKQGISMLRSVFAFTLDNEVADGLDYGIYVTGGEAAGAAAAILTEKGSHQTC
ncbi:hypothetical protein [Paenibacillus amylolyticus]|uniref:hypothetical protein n=1 Tax=Paenibacillus amylolyticus TaxID=1451 RepID=UPI00201E3462|nr:hypothetical protein [Paenibacillus amylolyticus]MCL6661585.1 hypothetical protein [Paenibacillus amylolyticus]